MRDSRRPGKLRCAGHGTGASLVVEAAEQRRHGPDIRAGTSHRRAGAVGSLGTQRSASAGDSPGRGGFTRGGPGGYTGSTGPTRPLRTRKRFRGILAIAKVILAVVVAFVAAVGLLFALTPSASEATALARAQAQARHIAYPGPSVPRNFARALIATEDHRFNSDPGVDPLAMARVAFSWITGHQDQGGSTIDQQLAKNLYTGGHSGFTDDVKQLAIAVKLSQAY